MELDRQEWLEYVRFCAGGEFPIPMGLISDYDDWLCRSIVGRMLLIRGKREEALQVLSTVVDVVPSREVPPEGLSEVEHKILCLRDIARLIWDYTHNADAALRYWDEAVELADGWMARFVSVARGEMHYGRAQVLMNAGRNEEAEKEIASMLSSDFFEGPEYNVNSNRYFALRLRAETAYADGNKEKAAAFLAEAFQYYPMSVEALENEAEALACADAEERYQKFMAMTKRQYLQWQPAAEGRGPKRGLRKRRD